MYKIIGADQKEYGPVTAGELRQWIAEGRADANTRIQLEGTTEWKPLRDFPEFASAFPPASAPPPFATAPVRPPGETTNGLAIAGLVCAVFGLFCCGPIFSTLGLIFSVLGLAQIKRDPFQRGRSLAIAGIILSVLGYLLFFGLISSRFIHPGWRRRRYLL